MKNNEVRPSLTYNELIEKQREWERVDKIIAVNNAKNFLKGLGWGLLITLIPLTLCIAWIFNCEVK